MTQQERVLGYLKSHKNGITSMQAFELFGATRLSAIAFELKKKGYDIICEPESAKNRYGDKVTYGRYKLVK